MRLTRTRLAQMDEPLRQAIKVMGGIAPLADAVGLARQGVYQWKRVPPTQAMAVESVTGLTRSYLRPDIYPVERELPMKKAG